jgi:D-threo-aldose 1-dehydrogenase
VRSALEPALAAGVAVVIAGVFNSGLLSTPWPPDDARYEYGPAPAELLACARRLAEICERHGTTLPAAAVELPLLHPAVAAVALGARDAAQLDTNLDRHEQGVPMELWDELVETGLLEPGAVARRR